MGGATPRRSTRILASTAGPLFARRRMSEGRSGIVVVVAIDARWRQWLKRLLVDIQHRPMEVHRGSYSLILCSFRIEHSKKHFAVAISSRSIGSKNFPKSRRSRLFKSLE